MSDPNEKTRLIRRSSSGDTNQPPMPPGPPASGDPSDPEKTIYGGVQQGGQQAEGTPDQTRIIRRGEPQETPAPAADPKTKLVRRSSKGAPAADADDQSGEGPVVGWLVVVEGPGRGKALTLGYGMNSLGREPGNRVSLPFGDEEISRNKHATVTYDPRGRKFYLQHGESSNLTYIGEDPVLAPTELKSGDSIRLGGETVLRFVPLCGDDFSWD